MSANWQGRVPSRTLQERWSPVPWMTLHMHIDQALLDMQFRQAVTEKERLWTTLDADFSASSRN